MMKIAVMAAIPSVIVFHAAVIAFPITREKLCAIVVRADPVSTFIRRTGPVSVMPAITAADGIPISVHPGKAGSGSSGMHCHNTRWRGRSDPDADANLSAQTESARQQNEWK